MITTLFAFLMAYSQAEVITSSGSSTQIATVSPEAMQSLLTEDLIRSLRDPFLVPLVIKKEKEAKKSDLELHPLQKYRLTGVIQGLKKNRAIVLSPDGKSIHVSLGEKIGLRLGRVTAIKKDMIQVTEYEVDDQGRKIPDVYEVRVNGEWVMLDFEKGRLKQ